MFWNSYLHAVEAMLEFIRAERSGNWQLYLDSMQAMLPVFFAYDRTNYSRWLPIYLIDMLNLPESAPEFYGMFAKGSVTVNRTGKKFASMAPDQVMEQTLNRDSKASEGIIGISDHEKARTKWFLTSHIRAQLLSLQKDFCQIVSQSSTLHKEDTVIKNYEG